MRLAVLADVHGNGDGLRATLADLDESGGADYSSWATSSCWGLTLGKWSSY